MPCGTAGLRRMYGRVTRMASLLIHSHFIQKLEDALIALHNHRVDFAGDEEVRERGRGKGEGGRERKCVFGRVRERKRGESIF